MPLQRTWACYSPRSEWGCCECITSPRKLTPSMSGRLFIKEVCVADVIRLEGIEVFAHHGVFLSERLDGQTFVIDVEV